MTDLTVNGLADALPDATNGNHLGYRSGRMNEAALKVASDHGWVAPKSYKYDADQPNTDAPGSNGVGLENGESKDDSETVETGTQSRGSKFAPGNWAHDAVRYEWKEEFGDVGPRSEKLEEELFKSKFINRAGGNFKK